MSFWTEHLRSLQESVLAQIKRARLGATHGTIKGSSIESILRKTLREYLPTQFSVGTGQFASVNGRVSPQLDIIIHDQHTVPRLAANEDGSVVVCCESVIAAIESKTRWDSSTADHFARFREVDNERQAAYRGPASYYVFVVEPFKPDDSQFLDQARMVAFYSLEEGVVWKSPPQTEEFILENAKNVIESLFQDVLKDAMCRGGSEVGDLSWTYEAVRQYFGWEGAI
jgi:hypothetical protein